MLFPRSDCQITKILGLEDHGFVDISAMALNAAIRGSILTDPDACLVMMMALPSGSARACQASPLSFGVERAAAWMRFTRGDEVSASSR